MPMATEPEASGSRLAPSAEPARSLRYRLLSQTLLLAMRVCLAASKALLTLYTARFLGLADLGVYGLLIAGTTIVPAVAGFGMLDWISRKLVDLPRHEALDLIAARMGLTLGVHLTVQPVLLAIDLWLGQPIPFHLAVLGGMILLLEHIGSDGYDLMIARRHILLAQVMVFVRGAVWPLLAIGIGLLYPDARTLTCMLFVWLLVLAANALVLLGLFYSRSDTVLVPFRIGLLLHFFRGSWILYVRDLTNLVSLFGDRFIISTVLGLELTGVYTLFWSIANVIHSLAFNGLLQAHVASLFGAARAGHAQLQSVKRRLQIEASAWVVLLSGAAAVATPLLLPFIDRPLLQEHVAVFWIVLLAMIMRIASDGYGLVLLALQRDRAIAIVAVAGAGSSALLTAVLTFFLSLWGAALAFALTTSGTFIARYWLATVVEGTTSHAAARLQPTEPVTTPASS